MKNKPDYSEVLKEFLPKLIANFKALPPEEAERRALGQLRRGQEYASIQREKLGKKRS